MLNEAALVRYTETEQRLGPVWAQVLNRSGWDLDDHFWRLGGTSMMITLLLFKVEERLHVRLEQADVIENPTLRELCALIDRFLIPAADEAQASGVL